MPTYVLNQPFSGRPDLDAIDPDGRIAVGDFQNGYADTVNIVLGPDFFISEWTKGIGRVDDGDEVRVFFDRSIAYSGLSSEEYLVIQLNLSIASERGQGAVTIKGSDDFGFYPIIDPPEATTSVACFTDAAQIETPDGLRSIGSLAPGDLVTTRDRGAQPVRWIGTTHLTHETLAQFPELQPVRIAADTLGRHAETVLSPQHRVLVSGWRASSLFGSEEVLAAVRDLTFDSGCRATIPAEGVTYVHLLFDRHELVRCDGLWSESFHPGRIGDMASARSRDEIVELFPELEVGAAADWSIARPSLDAGMVAVLFP